ncbi:hypothetical protein GTW67_20255, partial [Streptomyces sp. SID5910]|nr:hypothetical protein [Streptomyces sp. SID5910]
MQPTPTMPPLRKVMTRTRPTPRPADGAPTRAVPATAEAASPARVGAAEGTSAGGTAPGVPRGTTPRARGGAVPPRR